MTQRRIAQHAQVIMLWVHFNVRCNRTTQRQLHPLFRTNVKEWTAQGLIEGAVFKYHSDSLYVCLNIPTVTPAKHCTVQLSDDTVTQIPQNTINLIRRMCRQYYAPLEYIDYELEIQHAKVNCEAKGDPYYRGAPVEEIIRFASTGTKIALHIFKLIDQTKFPWAPEHDSFYTLIYTLLYKELGNDYVWLSEAFHFILAPLTEIFQ